MSSNASITKYRALFLILAQEKGWKFAQLQTQVDQYTKGQETITVKWAPTAMTEYLHTKGKNVVNHVTPGHQAKLQKLQAAMGGEDLGTKKWPKLSAAKVAELESIAARSFQVIEVAEPAAV